MLQWEHLFHYPLQTYNKAKQSLRIFWLLNWTASNIILSLQLVLSLGKTPDEAENSVPGYCIMDYKAANIGDSVIFPRLCSHLRWIPNCWHSRILNSEHSVVCSTMRYTWNPWKIKGIHHAYHGKCYFWTVYRVTGPSKDALVFL